MNGEKDNKDNDAGIEKKIDTGREERTYESYEPTKDELDDDNPPSKDSDSSDSDSE